MRGSVQVLIDVLLDDLQPFIWLVLLALNLVIAANIGLTDLTVGTGTIVHDQLSPVSLRVFDEMFQAVLNVAHFVEHLLKHRHLVRIIVLSNLEAKVVEERLLSWIVHLVEASIL